MSKGEFLAIFFLIMGVLVVPSLVFSFVSYRRMKRMEERGGGETLLATMQALKRELAESSHQNRLEVQQKLDSITGFLVKSQRDTTTNLQQQFKQSASIIKEVTERLSKLDETNRQVLDFSKQMRSLEDILKNPKQRGILGEYFLEAMLANVLQPGQYSMQHKFKNGEIVDAAVFYRDRIIPIDAKFSLEKYNRLMEEVDPATRVSIERDLKNDIKQRIDETSKYIRPAEGTTDFAFMFIPAEGVYYNLLIYNVGGNSSSSRDLVEYAFSRHVIIVSPTSFFAYLETVLQGLRQQKVEDNIKLIVKRVGELSKHLASYEDLMNRLGKNLSTTVNSYNQSVKEFGKIDRDIYRITDGESGGVLELEPVEKPEIE